MFQSLKEDQVSKITYIATVSKITSVPIKYSLLPVVMLLILSKECTVLECNAVINCHLLLCKQGCARCGLKHSLFLVQHDSSVFNS